VLETEWLMVREFRGDGFESLAEFYADPISSFYGGPCARVAAKMHGAIWPSIPDTGLYAGMAPGHSMRTPPEGSRV